MGESQIGILASHQGTTLQAIIDACHTGSLRAKLAIVITNHLNTTPADCRAGKTLSGDGLRPAGSPN
jgi:folate-dependent phosphoribosylglycinamide formyltransferase PurN